MQVPSQYYLLLSNYKKYIKLIIFTGHGALSPALITKPTMMHTSNISSLTSINGKAVLDIFHIWDDTLFLVTSDTQGFGVSKNHVKERYEWTHDGYAQCC